MIFIIKKVMKLKISEKQLNQLKSFLSENSKGFVLVDKNANVNDIKKYTDSGIKVAITDDGDEKINN